MFCFSGMNLFGQDYMPFIVKYQKVTRYNFEKNDNPRWNEVIASLPKETNSAYILYYKDNFALYCDNPVEQEAQPRELQRALHRQSMGRPPRPELKKVYYDLSKNEKINEVEFMTRNFLLESDMEIPAWKILNEKKKILDYICMSAEIVMDEDSYTAWFTPELPVSVGPDNFYGLPGLILAVEKNGETQLLASSVELVAPADGILVKPADGKKVNQEELDEIVKIKTEEQKKEFEAMMKNRKEGEGGRGHGH